MRKWLEEMGDRVTYLAWDIRDRHIRFGNVVITTADREKRRERNAFELGRETGREVRR